MKASWQPRNYDQAWERMAASGKDPHGEVAFLERLAGRHNHDLGHVLDAGCGTGRVAIELDRRGYMAEGTDIDTEMLDHARRKASHIPWHLANLTSLDLGARFDTVVAAGNVILFVDPSERGAAAAGLARHAKPGGYVVAGFQLNRDDGRRVALDEWRRWLGDAGLVEIEHFSTWDDDTFVASSDYVVAVHHQPNRN